MDILNEENEPLKTLLPVAKAQLKDVNLFMNDVKMELAHVCLAEANKTNEDSDPLHARKNGERTKL